MRENLLILGAGQYGLLVKEIAESTGKFSKIDFLDDANPIAVGKLEDYARLRGDYGCAVVAMGNPALRLAYLKRLEQAGYQIPVLRHPSAVVMPSARLGKGCVLEAMVVVNSNAVVGDGGLLCAGSVINHNATVGNVCQIDCNAVVAARATVPDGTKVPCATVFT